MADLFERIKPTQLNTVMSEPIAVGLPSHLKTPGLYTGSSFPGDREAASLSQQANASVANGGGTYTQGILTLDFALALCRAKMAMEGQGSANGFAYNSACCTAEWRFNSVYHSTNVNALSMDTGETGSFIYDSNTGKFTAEVGGASYDLVKHGKAPLIFTLFGHFVSKITGFRQVFENFCNCDLATEAGILAAEKMACCLCQSANDAVTSGLINVAPLSAGSILTLTGPKRSSQKYAPEEVIGNFQKFSFSGSPAKQRLKKFRSTKKFVGYFADPNRVLTEEERMMVPALDESYILPEEIVTACHIISGTKDKKRPMQNIMLRGDPSVGKTAGARAIAAGLGLPYTFVTCNAGTEMYNLIGDMMPVDPGTSHTINEELFADMPTATDISMDPSIAFEQITGKEKADATEQECFTEMFRVMFARCKEACSNGFRYVESPLVRAIRNGYVCELQEPSLISRPAVMPGLNGLLDETATIVLPTGEMLRRHPDCVIISTLNVDLEGCRPLNQAFLDRQHLIIDMERPKDSVIFDRIKGMTGCDDSIDLQKMLDVIRKLATVASRRGATDGNTNSMRSFASWVEAVMITGDYKKAAEWTVVNGVTADPDTRRELMNELNNYKF